MMELLLKQKRVIKSKVSRLVTLLENCTSLASNDKLSYSERISALEKDCNNLLYQISQETDDQEYESYAKEFDEIDDKIHMLKSRVREVGPSQNDGETNSTGIKSQLRLPKITLPSFSGNYDQWLSFHDLFSSTIHSNPTLSGAQKLQYLKASLKGEAAVLVQSIPITNANYDDAWAIIVQRYQNVREIISAHMDKLLYQSNVSNNSATELRHLVDTTNECVRAMKVHGAPVDHWDLILIHLVSKLIDNISRREWELSLERDELPSLQKFMHFLDLRAHALSVARTKENTKSSIEKKPGKVAFVHHGTTKSECIICKQAHFIYQCPDFLQLDVDKKAELVKKERLCFNCLKPGHMSRVCQNGKCKICKKRHNSLLHKETEKESEQTNSEIMSVTSHISEHDTLANHVLLSTALIEVCGQNNQFQRCRALIDSASQASFITTKCLQKLGLKGTETAITVKGLGAQGAMIAKECLKIRFNSISQPKYRYMMQMLVIPKISSILPNASIIKREWAYLNNIDLADPSYNNPGTIDILLGADIYGLLMKGGIVQGQDGGPTAIETTLGWILTGKVRSEKFKSGVVSLHIHRELDTIIHRFWELEDSYGQEEFSQDEMCEQHFLKTVQRDQTGRYSLQLPFKLNRKEWGNSRNKALQRLLSMERKLSSSPKQAEQYQAFLQQYLDLGHMEQVKPLIEPKDNQSVFYLPHHAVLRPGSTSTKLRVVFDGSSKSSNGISLNETLMIGSKIQENIFQILLRFRSNAIAMVADIRQMYRQILIQPGDRNYLRILWRPHPSQGIQEYCLKTVTYGTACAPFQATRCLKQLAQDEHHNWPQAAETLERDFYMDDLLSGANTQTLALQLQADLIQLLSSAGFKLCKWSSNCAEILKAIPEDEREVKIPFEIEDTQSIKSLGVKWYPANDYFSFQDGHEVTWQMMSKRTLLSELAKIYDPLGWLAPVTIIAKILFQRVWQTKIGWDEAIPKDTLEQWNKYIQDLRMLSMVKIERHIGLVQAIHYEFHIFSDASEQAYAAVAYLEAICGNGQRKLSLLASKTKVAPIKKVSLPRLELCGALLASQLIKEIKKALTKFGDNISMYTDSMIVLGWIKAGPSRWKPFVANRVKEIYTNVGNAIWYHIGSKTNPADCASRGLSLTELLTHNLWWKGPSKLKEISKNEDQVYENILEERKKLKVKVLHIIEDCELIEKFSTVKKLQRVTAWCKRFMWNAKHDKQERKYGSLTVEELNQALQTWIIKTQKKHFSQEIMLLSEGKVLQIKSKILSLNPFIDKEGLLRVGGRLSKAKVSENRKHPILLPAKHQLTRLIIRQYHIDNLHAESLALLTALQGKYWIINARSLIRGIIRKCIHCYKLKAKAIQQMMGELPAARVNPSPPFSHTGLDFAGPLILKGTGGRKNSRMKGYLCIFICYSTRAIHLELVSNLTSEAFLASLKRFVARRGKPCNLYSDCGSNFLGASAELIKITKEITKNIKDENISNYLSHQGTNWHFNPPSAPHFGGLWEAGIKSVKFHLKRVIGNAILNFEEMATVLCQVEACLNSRPLTALSDNPMDLNALTPGHFLIGAPMTAIPELDVRNLKLNRLNRWQLCQQVLQHFWQRWSKEYLARLQQRPKWWLKKDNVQVGDLILLRDETAPPLKWKLGRILQTYPGSDDLIRAVTVRTAQGEFKRPVTKICLLPLDEEVIKD